MFLHAGASLHGHEFSGHNRPQSPTNTSLHRKKPYIRSALPAPMLRPASFTAADAYPPPQTPKTRRRPVSEVYVRPISDQLDGLREPARTPAAPVVRFKEPDVVETPKTSVTDEDPSVYDSDASSQTSSAVHRRRKRAPAPRKSTTYLLARPAPKLGSNKHLLQHVRPRLLLQLQELPADQRRPRPTIDVFPSSLIAGPFVTARYIHRFPRIFGVKSELGPRDLILVKSEEYDTSLSETEEDDENGSGRREPVAVLSPVRGLDCDEIVLDDGTVWTARLNQKGGFDFVHVDKHGITLTARWVKQKTTRSTSTAPGSRPLSPSPSFTASTTNGSSPADSTDYRYTFSIINPLTRRHPILASLTPSSLEVFEDYTTVSSSQGRYPPSRTSSYNQDSATNSTMSLSPTQLSPAANKEPSAERRTYPVDEASKKLIMVSGLWLTIRLGGRTTTTTTAVTAAAAPESAEAAAKEASFSKEPSMSIQSCVDAVKKQRRQTTSNAVSSTPALPPNQPRGLRRAMSTGAAFMQRRMRQNHSHASEAGGSNSSTYYMAAPAVMELDEMSSSDDSGAGAEDKENKGVQRRSVMATNAGSHLSTALPASAPLATQQQTQPQQQQQQPQKEQQKQQKQSRRVSWMNKLRH